MEQQGTHIFDALAAIIHTFSPGVSQLIRLVSVMLEIDLLSYSLHVCLLLAMPTLFTFILPKTFKFLKPCFQIFISSTEIHYRNNLYPEITKWMSTMTFHSLSSSVIAGTSESFNYYWDVAHAPEFVDTANPAYYGKVIKVRYTPGYSCLHFFQYENCWFALYRDPQHNRNDPLSRNAENIKFYCFSWKKRTLYRLLEHIQMVNIDSRRGKVRVLSGYQIKDDVTWRTTCEEDERDLESLALPKDIKDSLVSELEWFFRNDVKEYYKKRGIPYRRGLVFSGAPGTGKTSLCRALATNFGLSIYAINLATLDNSGLQELFRTLPASPCLVLLEDIDSAGIKREVSTVDAGSIQGPASHQSAITIATILNTMDGIGSAKSGHILVATTNVLPALDEAMTRPGRIDRIIEFDNPDIPTIVDYFCYFFGGSEVAEMAIKFAKEIPYKAITPAALQGYFLLCNNDPAKAVDNVCNLVPR